MSPTLGDPENWNTKDFRKRLVLNCTIKAGDFSSFEGKKVANNACSYFIHLGF